jgi:hypothetical protein
VTNGKRETQVTVLLQKPRGINVFQRRSHHHGDAGERLIATQAECPCNTEVMGDLEKRQFRPWFCRISQGDTNKSSWQSRNLPASQVQSPWKSLWMHKGKKSVHPLQSCAVRTTK